MTATPNGASFGSAVAASSAGPETCIPRRWSTIAAAELRRPTARRSSVPSPTCAPAGSARSRCTDTPTSIPSSSAGREPRPATRSSAGTGSWAPRSPAPSGARPRGADPIARGLELFERHFGESPAVLVCPGNACGPESLERAFSLGLEAVAADGLAVRRGGDLEPGSPGVRNAEPDLHGSRSLGALIPAVACFHDRDLAQAGVDWLHRLLARWRSAGADRFIDLRELTSALGLRLALDPDPDGWRLEVVRERGPALRRLLPGPGAGPGSAARRPCCGDAAGAAAAGRRARRRRRLAGPAPGGDLARSARRRSRPGARCRPPRRRGRPRRWRPEGGARRDARLAVPDQRTCRPRS